MKRSLNFNKNFSVHNLDLLAVLALAVKIRKFQDFLAPISGDPGDQFLSLTFRNLTYYFLKLSFME